MSQHIFKTDPNLDVVLLFAISYSVTKFVFSPLMIVISVTDNQQVQNQCKYAPATYIQYLLDMPHSMCICLAIVN